MYKKVIQYIKYILVFIISINSYEPRNGTSLRATGRQFLNKEHLVIETFQ